MGYLASGARVSSLANCNTEMKFTVAQVLCPSCHFANLHKAISNAIDKGK